MTYKAIVGQLSNVHKHPNADRLAIGIVNGFQVIVGLDAKDGDIGAFFNTDGKLSEIYCEKNDLLRRKNPDGTNAGGMFDANRKVRSQRLRGEISDGYFASLDSLKFTGYNVSKLKPGFEFDELNGVKLCEKYVTQATLNARAKQAGKQARTELKMFRKHFETEQFRNVAEKIPQGALLTITEKMHGCMPYNTRITMANGKRKYISDIKVGEYVLGINQAGDVVPSQVGGVFQNGPSEEWITICGDRSAAGKGNSFFNLKLTPNHLVYITGKGYVQAENLVVGDMVSVPCSGIFPSEDQCQIILGGILGDSYFSVNKYSAKIQYGHKKDHAEYTDWMQSALGNLSNPTVQIRTSGYGTEMVCAQTKSSIHVKNKFLGFSGGKNKSIPSWVSDKLGPLSIAVWFMDDGSLFHNSQQYQRDRVGFAACDFTEQDCKIIQAGLSKHGVETVYYVDSGGYSRLRANADFAQRLFSLVAEYIPPPMQYKLPLEYRGRYIKREFQNGEMLYALVDQPITSIERSKTRQQRWDLETETHNFFASDVWVHNSSHRMAYVLDNKKMGWLEKWVYQKLRRPFPRQWVYLHGSRNIILDGGLNDPYYNSQFRQQAVNKLQGNLHKGEVIYLEIVGYINDTTPIMAVHNVAKQKDKEMLKAYGKEMIYRYGNVPGQCSAAVYRITMVNEDGVATELSWEQVKRRCRELGVDTVPELFPPFIYDGDSKKLRQLCEAHASGPSILDHTHIREGVCVRVEHENMFTIVKLKNFQFLEMESNQKDDDAVVDMEEAA